MILMNGSNRRGSALNSYHAVAQVGAQNQEGVSRVRFKLGRRFRRKPMNGLRDGQVGWQRPRDPMQQAPSRRVLMSGSKIGLKRDTILVLHS